MSGRRLPTPGARRRQLRRVLVIGAGHNGLVCAARLAAAGLDVTVLEQASRPGGAVRSDELPPGFVHDTCSGFFPLARISPAMRDLPLAAHGVRWISPQLAMVHPFLAGGELVLHRELERTVESLERLAPGSGAAWRQAAGPLVRHGRLLADAVLGPFPPVLAGARLLARLRGEAPEAARRALLSAAGLGRELSDDPRVGAWLAGSTMHGDLGPDESGGAGFAMLLGVLAHVVGWPLVAGGAGRLTDALVAHLVRLGGNVRCGAPVRRIEADRRVRGVVLADGERLAADAVVATPSAGALAPLLGDALGPRLAGRLRAWRYGWGTFKVDYALAGPAPWASEPARQAAVVHLGDTLEEMRDAAREIAAGRVPRRPMLVVGQQSLHDPSRAPADRQTLYAYFRCPSRIEDAERVADRVDERIERFAPGFRELVLDRWWRSPAQLEAENPSLAGGDLAGGSVVLAQQLAFRPAPELFRGRTPLRGLYLAGASNHPGPGVHGAPGAGAAAALLADRSPLRLRRS